MSFLGVFKGMTRYTAAAGSLEGCSFMSAGNAGGIMCCKDDDTTPTFPPTSIPTGGACDFERGLCNWLVNQLAAGRFSRRKGETPSRNTGPRYDHTKKDSTGKVLTNSFLCSVQFPGEWGGLIIGKPFFGTRLIRGAGGHGGLKPAFFGMEVFTTAIPSAASICNDIFRSFPTA